jgi:hypothetical protein
MLFFLSVCTGMDFEMADCSTESGMATGMAAGTAASGERGETAAPAPPDPTPQHTTAQAAENKTGKKHLDLGATYRQCSSARSAGSTMTVTKISNGNCTFTSATSPAIGSLDWPGDKSVLKTFTGEGLQKTVAL